MTKVFQIIIVAIALTSTAYSQQVRSSMFHLDIMEYNNDIIRAVSPNEIVVKTSSGEGTAFAFISNSTVQHYVDVPQGYTVNDFEILDGYVYFCGKALNEDKGCIGILNMHSADQTMGLCKIATINMTKNLTRLVAYEGHIASTVGVVAIGEPEDAYYTSCVVDFNNYDQSNGWRYYLGFSTKDYITDITLVAPNELATVGREKSGYYGQTLDINRLCVRSYKRPAVLISEIVNDVYCFSYLNFNSNDTYLATQVYESNIAVAKLTPGGLPAVGGVTTASVINPVNSIVIKIIDISTMSLVKEQTIDTTGSKIKDMVYFPNWNRLGIVSSFNDGIGEVYFPYLSTNSNYYTTFKFFMDDTYLNSIARFDNDSFIMTSFLNGNYAPISTHFIHENLNNYNKSSCTRVENIKVATVAKNVIPTYLCDVFHRYNYYVDFHTYQVTANETEIILDCTSY